MTVDSNSVCVEPLADRRRSADRPRVAAGAELPREVVDVLRLRGVARGPVLLLTASAAGGGGHEAAPQFQLTCGALNEAPALASRGGGSRPRSLISGAPRPRHVA